MGTNKSLNILYNELLARETELKKMNLTDRIIKGRLEELKLLIVRIQQLLLEELTNEMESRKTTEG
jgi:hypothetical protein